MYHVFPSIKTYAKHQLDVDPPHQLYVEESGNPEGKPAIILHDGPGEGSEPYHRRFFDPDAYRIISFDQRGSGRSLPNAEINQNDTRSLIKDIETIRQYLNVKQFVLFGHGWGSALGLLYAQQYPQHVSGLILIGLFLARTADIQWFYGTGAQEFYPDYWQDFLQSIANEHPNTLLRVLQEKLNGNDELARMSVAKGWALWRARCASLQPHQQLIDRASDPHFAKTFSKIVCHYFLNRCFLEENQILNQMSSVTHLPGYLIHGRFDMLCPLSNTWKLHKQWPNSEMFIVREAGHSLKEPALIDAIIVATKRMVNNKYTSA